ncbi:hypothetical protein CMI37_20620 [Candidatus Pacearchaeota archaeon]|nr:hypothetical protein [Candidatus Pacearchaeota archaeon]
MISEGHIEQFNESGICGACIGELDKSGLVQSTADGLRLNYLGAKEFYRTRLDAPEGKRKYTQPPGAKPRLYFTREDDETKSLFITEGEKKALSMACRFKDKAVAVGLGGVWNWTGGKSDESRMLIHDFTKLHLNDRQVYVVFDSDLVDNQQVQDAERFLAEALRKKGARVKLITLPPEKKGIDDWLVAWGKNWDAEINALCREAKKHRAQDSLEEVYAKVYSFRDMVGTDFPVPKFFCGDERFGIVNQGGICIVHGTTNVGKTFLTTQLAVCIATGEEWLGHQCEPAKVLFFQGELPPGLYARGRLRPILKERAIPDNLSFYNWSFNLAASSRFKETFNGDSWVGFDKLEEILDEHRPEVIIFDPLQSFHNIVETSNDQLRELFKRFKRLALERNLGIVVVDHDRKGGDAGHSSVRGASAKTDLSDSVIGLTRDDQRDIWMHYDKIRYIGQSLPGPIHVHMDGAWFKLGQSAFHTL